MKLWNKLDAALASRMPLDPPADLAAPVLEDALTEHPRRHRRNVHAAAGHVDRIANDPRHRRYAWRIVSAHFHAVGRRPLRRRVDDRKESPARRLEIPAVLDDDDRRFERIGTQRRVEGNGTGISHFPTHRRRPRGARRREFEPRRTGDRIDHGVDTPVSKRVDERGRVDRCAFIRAAPGLFERRPHGERLERGLVGRQRQGALVPSRLPPAAERHPRVRVVAGDRDHPPALGQRVPPPDRRRRPIEERHDRLGTAKPVRHHGTQQRPLRLVAPLAVGVQPLHAVEVGLPGMPRQFRLRRIGMRDDAESTQPPDVLDDVARLAGETIRRARHAQGDVVAVGRADLDAIDHEHAGDVARRVHEAGRVAMVGQHDEVETRARGGVGHFVLSAGAVGGARVHVDSAADGQRVRSEGKRPASRRQYPPHGAGGGDERRESGNTDACHRLG